MGKFPLGGFVPPVTITDITADEQRLISDFGDLYYSKWAHGKGLSTIQVSWLGYETLKCPLDLWIYQEIITRDRPDFVVELGTRFGGSALYLACILDMIGSGMVITVDLDDTLVSKRPLHERIIYKVGSTTEASTVEAIEALIPPGSKVLLILDSDHTRDHVLKEMRMYSHLVPVGGYMIVEDTNINGHPTYPEYGPGPFEAVEAFLHERDDFAIDLGCERLLLTMNPCGYLKRVRHEPSQGPI
jgi:cephalosporin hydroxylase